MDQTFNMHSGGDKKSRTLKIVGITRQVLVVVALGFMVFPWVWATGILLGGLLIDRTYDELFLWLQFGGLTTTLMGAGFLLATIVVSWITERFCACKIPAPIKFLSKLRIFLVVLFIVLSAGFIIIPAALGHL